MDKHFLITQAKKIELEYKQQREAAYYVKTIAWFHYLGLLRHNKIKPKRYKVTLNEALKAGVLEPRIFELLPAIIVVFPKALVFRKSDIPLDLATIAQEIREKNATQDFRMIPASKYLYWLKAPIINIAKRRFDSHLAPRRRNTKTHAIGETIRNGRLALAMTQAQLAKKYGVSLRIVRDLEQGKLNASLKSVNDILEIFGRSLKT